MVRQLFHSFYDKLTVSLLTCGSCDFLQTDEDPAHAYIQTFVLKPIGTSFYVQHDVFRLALHDCV